MDIQDTQDNPGNSGVPYPVRPVSLRFIFLAVGIGVLFAGGAAPVGAQSSAPVASPSRIDPAAYQRIVEENLELRRGELKAETELGELRRKNAALLVDVQDLERRKNQLALLMSQLKTPDEMKADLTRLQSDKQVLLGEIDRLHRAVTPPPSPVSNSVPGLAPAPGSDLFRKVEKENADLRQELAKVKEALQVETAARAVLAQSEATLKADLAGVSETSRKSTGELNAARRQEAVLKKALEAQARKAFESDKAVQEMKAQLLEARKQASDAEAAARKALDGASGKAAVASASAPGVGEKRDPAVADLLASARQLLAHKKAREAESLYLKAVKLEPGNPQVQYNLGILYGDYLNEPRKAAGYYRTYLKLAPRASDAAAVRGWIMELDARAR